jgi:hypothetical protein
MLHEILRLADYGRGHDARARDGRLGRTRDIRVLRHAAGAGRV